MKKVKYCLHIFVLLFVFFLLFGICTYAEEENAADELLSEFRQILPGGYEGFADAEGVIGALGPDALLYEVVTAIYGESGRILGFFFTLLGLCVLIVIGGLVEGDNKTLVGCVISSVVGTVAFFQLYPIVREVAQSLLSIGEFFSLITPILITAVASGGGVNAASTAALGLQLTLGGCSFFNERVLLLISSLMFISGIVSSFGGGVGRLASGVKGFFIKGLGLLCTILMGTLSLQTLLSASTDNVAMRAARYAATNMIPIVGGTVAGAMSTLVSGLAYSKGIVGVGGIGVIVTMAILPLVSLLLYKLCFFLAISFLEFAGAGELARPILALRDALDALISVFALSAVIYVFEIILLLKCEVTW